MPERTRRRSGQIAKDFGIREPLPRNRLDKTNHADAPTDGTQLAAELRETKRRIRLLSPENEILGRAAAYCSGDIN